MQAALDKDTIAFASTLADAAGEVVRRHFRVPLSIDTKADKSPVTEADREVETVICDLIAKRFPDHGIFGEEHGKKNESAVWQWVIDPIDGTRSFIAGYPIFTTLIALVKDNVPVLGIIDQAVTGERWLGVSGTPTLYNGKPCVVHKKTSLAEAVIATTSTGYFKEDEADTFTYLKNRCRYAMLSGDAYAYAMLVCGRVDIVVDVALKPYDFCALRPVIEGAGGVFTNWEGHPITLQSEGHVIAAANTELHHQAMALLRSTVT